MFQDIGLTWGMDKCAGVDLVRGKLQHTQDTNLSANEKLKMLDETDTYKFLGKFENSKQLEDQVFEETSREYLKRLSVIWTSNISIPRKIRGTNTFALPVLQYQMWTGDWTIDGLKTLDRRTREIIKDNGGMHKSESTKLLYLPSSLGGSGLKSVEDTYKVTTIKAANYINNSTDTRIKLVRSFEKLKAEEGRKSVFKQATKYALEYNIECTFTETGTLLTTESKTTQVNLASPRAIKDTLSKAVIKKISEELHQQKWLGDLTTKQHQDLNISDNTYQIHTTWKNVPDIVCSVNKTIRQQLLPTKTYYETKLLKQVLDKRCRMCNTSTESTTHVMCACSRIAQTLYKARHDKLLRPLYHYLLYKYRFQESDHSKPWYQQRLPEGKIENDHAKILWDVPFYLERAPKDGANKPDIAVLDKDNNTWILIEGTVCSVGTIGDRSKTKEEKYSDLRMGLRSLYKECTVTQINIVFDFLGGYYPQLEQGINILTDDRKETTFIITKCQKWLLSQNAEIVKKFYEFI
ncbi:uncharacterized protein LOC110245482 [Exaiptasia diaphana]|uniref:Reverse transcriptase n=1 Tax=Exaiptasia diaphana TaxID=2652724 RepID=A0A913XP32_EXADI|nr:uncharacterized protein LOC110245482 [Exaiptasia diaphana]